MNAYLALTKSSWDFGKENVSLKKVVWGNESKHTFYQNLVKAYKKEWEDDKSGWYKTCYDRYYKPSNFGQCTVLDFTVQSEMPLAVGHGVASVLETNLTLHPIYGVPYLPGTALKGLTAHYAQSILGGKYPALSRNESDYDVLFGTHQSAGFIQFHDALITPETVCDALMEDVLTPHHKSYNNPLNSKPNSKKEHPAPRDDDSPSPIPFLAARGAFRIFLVCEGDPDQASSWLELARTIFMKAIAEEGIGAKTNVGYGRLAEK